MSNTESPHSDGPKAEEQAPESEGAGGRARLTRRGALALGGVAGAGLFVGGIFTGAGIAGTRQRASAEATPTPTASANPPTRSFVSTDLTTSRMTSVQSGETAAGYVFAEPEQKGKFNGVIMDNRAEPVWIAPTDVDMTGLTVQTYQGKPVLTYWSGKSISGHGDGVGNILDTSYNQIATVHAAPGMQADLHEFHLTPQGTALMTAFPVAKADLTSVGGPKNGYILNCHVNEIDIATGAVLLDWSAMDHIAVDETFASVKNPADADGTTVAKAFDAYHLNSIDYDDEGNLYISSRHTHTIYSINRKTGEVNWRMGGKKSDFAIDDDAAFAWQHHVRVRPNGMFSIFNNHSRTTGAPLKSWGLLVDVDQDKRTVKLNRKLEADVLTIAMGSVQLLKNGNWMVGWGTVPMVTEFGPDGTPVLTISGLGTGSYRAFRNEWVAMPQTIPDVAVRGASGGRMTVYASWNGATEVRTWRVRSGSSSSALDTVTLAPRSGFETAIVVPRSGSAVVDALDLDGNVLSTSKVVSAA